MADELLAPAAQGEKPAPEVSDRYPLGRDPLDIMRALKRWTRLIVYPAVTALIPFSHFLLGTPWLSALISHAVGGYFVATLGIEFGFWYGWRLRKEAAYPTMLAMDLGTTEDFAQACERAVRLLAGLLGAEKVVLAWRNQEDGSLATVSTHGIPPEDVPQATSPSWWQQNVRQSIDEHKVVVAPAGDGHPWQSTSGGRSWVAYVPLLSLDKVVGLLILVGGQKSSDLRDKMLLAPIGLTIGLTLENLRHTVELRRRSDDYIATTNLTGDVIAKLDTHGNWAFLNDAACQFFGKPREELLGTDSRAFLHPEDIETTAQAIRETMNSKNLLRGAVSRFATPMGIRVIEWNGYPLFDEESQYVGIQITGRDITERKQMEEALAAKTKEYIDTTNLTGDLIAKLDKHGNWAFLNDAACQFYGKPREELLGTDSRAFVHPDDLEPTAQAIRNTRTKKALVTGFVNRQLTPVGTRVVEWNGYPLFDEQGQYAGIQITGRDITERKQMEEERQRLLAELEVRATTDSLTGLYNHAHFYQRLSEEIERSKRHGHPLAVVMMDIDNFKEYNDSRGHQAGDKALHLIADCIRKAIRRSDIAFRYGGDEFAAILPHADSARAQAVVNRINRRIAARLKEMNDPAAAWLGVSAGVASYPEDAATVGDLVTIADTALYDDKGVALAHAVMGQGQSTESGTYPPVALHETQTRVLSTAARELAAALQDVGAPDVFADLNVHTVAAIGAAAEIKDPYIRGHQQRASRWAAALAEEMGLSPEQVRNIRIAGLLHDLGKVGVSESILNKPGKLTEEEYAKIKEHPALGAMMIISEVESLQRLVPIVRHHHERFDGKGYPDGLAGEQIPLEARIMSVVDVFDAMTHDRAYRKALSKEETIAELERGAGTQFDPAVVKAFLAVVKGRGEEQPAPAQAAGEDKQMAAARTAGRRNA
jgi:diguanylate cyclase (GGDEF)-like protein/PAS domain S-box-containing protein